MKPAPLTERSFVAPAARTFADDYIEHWAAQFERAEIRRQLRARGIGFEAFLHNPEQILAALARPVRLAVEPGLLAAQRAVQARLDAEAAMEQITDRAVREWSGSARYANGAWVEPLHHHAHPRRTFPYRKQKQEATR